MHIIWDHKVLPLMYREFVVSLLPHQIDMLSPKREIAPRDDRLDGYLGVSPTEAVCDVQYRSTGDFAPGLPSTRIC